MRTIRPAPSPSLLAGIALAFLVAMPAVPAAGQTPIPGTTVSLDAPAGFTLSSAFSGLENKQDGSTITITELPSEAYADLAQVFSNAKVAAESLAPRGIRIDRREQYVVGDRQVPVLIGTERSSGGDVGKYMALYQGDMTVLITINAFDARVLTPDLVEATLKSVRLAAAAPLEQKIAQLPFSFSPAAPFRVQDTIGGSGVLLPVSGDPNPTGLMPVVIIARALSAISPSSSVSLVAQQMLRGIEGFEDATITTGEETEFAGGPGYRLEAVAVERTAVLFVRIPPDGVYVRLAALGETAALQKVMPAVMNIAQSVSIR